MFDSDDVSAKGRISKQFSLSSVSVSVTVKLFLWHRLTLCHHTLLPPSLSLSPFLYTPSLSLHSLLSVSSISFTSFPRVLSPPLPIFLSLVFILPPSLSSISFSLLSSTCCPCLSFSPLSFSPLSFSFHLFFHCLFSSLFLLFPSLLFSPLFPSPLSFFLPLSLLSPLSISSFFLSTSFSFSYLSTFSFSPPLLSPSPPASPFSLLLCIWCFQTSSFYIPFKA